MNDVQIERMLIVIILMLVASLATTFYVLNRRAENLRKDMEHLRKEYEGLVQHIVDTFSPK